MDTSLPEGYDNDGYLRMTPDRIRTARLALGLTAGGLASVVRVDVRTIQRYEDGTRQVPGSVERLIEVLLHSAQAREICGLKAYPKPGLVGVFR